jgi:hypothetical protein
MALTDITEARIAAPMVRRTAALSAKAGPAVHSDSKEPATGYTLS